MLKLYNTLTRSKEIFVPLVPGEVRMYVCGMTVYDYCHIGHARMLVAFDAIQRWLRASGFDVTYVRNITDIDDKIIRRAVENGETIAALTARFITAMQEDEAALGIQRPDAEPRATGHVPQMLEMIGRLRENGYAYESGEGDVVFSVRKFEPYGRLSGKAIDDLRAGERVAVGSGKQDPLDFVLWKAAKPDEPGEVKWASAFGCGRPGWHIECSAMSTTLLGSPFDIHGGGADLQFPHHENEIAQSDAALYPDGSRTFVRYWLHNGFVQVNDEKMSKSLGNFFTIRDVLKDHDGEVVRFFILRSHYRSPLNYTRESLDEAREGLLRLYNALSAAGGEASVEQGVGERVEEGIEAGIETAHKTGAETEAETRIDWQDPRAERFAAAMNDDFNTVVAVAVLFELAAECNRGGAPGDRLLLRQLAAILGLLGQAPEAVRRSGLRGSSAAAAVEAGAGQLSDEAIEQRIATRAAAKKARQYAEADAIRAELAALGILLEDSATGTRWRR
jgi:cysteinyl-tRNA synthetase